MGAHGVIEGCSRLIPASGFQRGIGPGLRFEQTNPFKDEYTVSRTAQAQAQAKTGCDEICVKEYEASSDTFLLPRAAHISTALDA